MAFVYFLLEGQVNTRMHWLFSLFLGGTLLECRSWMFLIETHPRSIRLFIWFACCLHRLLLIARSRLVLADWLENLHGLVDSQCEFRLWLIYECCRLLGFMDSYVFTTVNVKWLLSNSLIFLNVLLHFQKVFRTIMAHLIS